MVLVQNLTAATDALETMYSSKFVSPFGPHPPENLNRLLARSPYVSCGCLATLLLPFHDYNCGLIPYAKSLCLKAPLPNGGRWRDHAPPMVVTPTIPLVARRYHHAGHEVSLSFFRLPFLHVTERANESELFHHWAASRDSVFRQLRRRQTCSLVTLPCSC